MEDGTGLPPGLCCSCSLATISAFSFRQTCLQSHSHWIKAIDSLHLIGTPSQYDKTYYIFYNDGTETIVKDQMQHATNKEEALTRLTSKVVDESDMKRRPERLVLKCQCPDCGKPFTMPHYLNEHLKGSAKRACLRCGDIVPRKLYAKHLERKHYIKMFSCEKCFELFDAESAYKHHQFIYHANHKEACQVCRASFVNLRALRAHMYSHNLFHCTSCNASYENRKCIKYHQRVCSNANKMSNQFANYICDYCNAKYDRKPSLKTHIIQKHLQVLPFVCQTCGKRTSTLAHLRSHETVHMAKRKIYQCRCGAKMRTELGLKLHQRIHSGERPYQCEECGDCFLSSSRRLDHIKRRHRSSKDMAHGCEKCPARFVRPFELKKHYMSVHLLDVDISPVKRKLRKGLS